MNDEEIIRKQAVELYLKGISVIDIGLKLNKSRQWVHKWINRYRSIGGDEWYISKSRSPKQVHGKTPQRQEDLVIKIRKSLEGRNYSQTGALSIMYEFEHMGLKAPSITTINRILKRNNQIKLSNEKQKKKQNIQTALHLFNRWIWWVPNTLKEVFASTSRTLSIQRIILQESIR
jgi:putative transposase